MQLNPGIKQFIGLFQQNPQEPLQVAAMVEGAKLRFTIIVARGHWLKTIDERKESPRPVIHVFQSPMEFSNCEGTLNFIHSLGRPPYLLPKFWEKIVLGQVIQTLDDYNQYNKPF